MKNENKNKDYDHGFLPRLSGSWYEINEGAKKDKSCF